MVAIWQPVKIKGVELTISSRIKEERLRLGMSQTAFAAIAGVTKSAQIKWESGTSSAPTAPALAAYAEAGADVFYIVTGKRLPDRPDIEVQLGKVQLDKMERDLISPWKAKLPDEDEAEAEARIRTETAQRLSDILAHDAFHPDLVERANSLLQAARDPHSLSLLRAADFAQAHKRREEEKELLYIWLGQWPYRPDNAVLDIMARITLEYGVPHKTMVELSHKIYSDIEDQRSADRVIELSERENQKADAKKA